nr:14746_t:CDS:2 [Entrophospora candida]
MIKLGSICANGGVSSLSLLASVMDGFIIGIFELITIVVTGSCVKIWHEIIIISSFAGVFGSLVDSLLDATVQQTNYSEKLKKIIYWLAELPSETHEFRTIQN